MAGLVGYDSSDEEETHPEEASQISEPPKISDPELADRGIDRSALEPGDAQKLAANAPILGPSLPSDTSLVGHGLQEPDEESALNQFASHGGNRSSSPYSATQSLLRDLTLPAVPNLDIPPSPPGTPPPSLAVINKRLDTFLELKRKRGTHFNDRLSQSNAARNPALMEKLLNFVGIESAFEETSQKADPVAQYATTLPVNLWDPGAFPDWAFRGPLRKSQETVQKEQMRAPGDPVQFVAASINAPSRTGSQSGTPTSASGRKKSRFDK